MKLSSYIKMNPMSGQKGYGNMVVKVCGMTDIGKRRELNEDSFEIRGFENGTPLGVCILADGMGGHNAGEVASSMAAKAVADELCESFDEEDSRKIIKNMASAIDYANATVFEKSLSSREHAGMGTTLVAAYVKDASIRFANIGDSRAYVANNESICKITVDHSVVEEMVQRGAITREEARVHPDKNIITRALGTENYVDADFYDYSASAGETVVLCSDGLTETVSEEEIHEIVTADEDVCEIVKKLIDKANENGGLDNITVVVIRFEKEEKSDDADR